MSRVLRRGARQGRAMRKMPENPECFCCGYDVPEGLKSSRRSVFERHHLQQLPPPEEGPWVVVCLNCHARLSASQQDTGAFPSRYRHEPARGARSLARNLIELLALLIETQPETDPDEVGRLNLVAEVFDEVFEGLDGDAPGGRFAEIQALLEANKADVQTATACLAGADFTPDLAELLAATDDLRSAAEKLSVSAAAVVDNPQVGKALEAMRRATKNCARIFDVAIALSRPELLAAAITATAPQVLGPGESE